VLIREGPGRIASLGARRRTRRLGPIGWGPLQPEAILIAPRAAEEASGAALVGVVAHEAAHAALGHATSGWVRSRVCVLGFVAVMWSASESGGLGWGALTATALLTGWAWFLFAQWASRRDELTADAAAVALAGVVPVLACLNYLRSADTMWTPRSRWVGAVVSLAYSHPLNAVRVRAVETLARRGD
jgi:Zn-dependent protease with chaperone function